MLALRRLLPLVLVCLGVMPAPAQPARADTIETAFASYAPASQLVRTLAEPAAQFVRLLAAYRDKQQQAA